MVMCEHNVRSLDRIEEDRRPNISYSVEFQNLELISTKRKQMSMISLEFRMNTR